MGGSLGTGMGVDLGPWVCFLLRLLSLSGEKSYTKINEYALQGVTKAFDKLGLNKEWGMYFRTWSAF